MNEPDYVVIRPAPGLPDGFVPPHWDGRWIDRATLPQIYAPPGGQWSSATAVPTGHFEVREDGAVAEVFEVRGAGPVRPGEETTA
jgi:hypothetical protein